MDSIWAKWAKLWRPKTSKMLHPGTTRATHPRNSTRVAQPPAGAVSEILLLSYLRKVGAHLLETLGHPIFGDSLWSFEDF